MLEVIGLTCSRNEKVLFKNLSFGINPGSGLQICAANGGGKTTLLKIIAGLLPPTYGQIHKQQAVLYLGHKQNVHPALTVMQNLVYLHTINSSTSQNINVQILKQALEYVELSSFTDELCAHLSAGQLQRINLARLYLSSAKLWLLDEPFANLDSSGQTLLLQICTRHLSAAGALLLTSHTTNSVANINLLELNNYA